MKACLFTGVCIWVVSVVAIPAADRIFHLPDVPYQYAYLDLPSHFTETKAQSFDNTPADNPITDGGATLGRVLFYDTRLSANGTISCGSCHVQSHAFVDPNRFSKGFKGGLTDRHAMNLVNLKGSNQEVTLYQVGDIPQGICFISITFAVAVYSSFLLHQGASFNNFLDALDGSYCTFDGGDGLNQDAVYPDTSPNGYPSASAHRFRAVFNL